MCWTIGYIREIWGTMADPEETFFMDCLQGISSEYVLECKWDDREATLLYSLPYPADDKDSSSFLAA